MLETVAQSLFLGLLLVCFVYLAVRAGSVAYFRTRNEFNRRSKNG